MQKILIFLVHAYRYTVKPFLGSNCRFYPSCSEYALEALQVHGAWHGFLLAIKRISRCHPWHSGGIDPVPDVQHNHLPHSSSNQSSSHKHG